MKKFAFWACLMFVLFFFGCDRVETEQSKIIHEDALIMETVYTPSRHDTDLGLRAIGSGAGTIGIDFGGNVGIGIGSGLQISSVEIPEKFAVVFKCQHGKFIVERKEVYKKLKGQDGKAVDVSYTEVYRTTYKKQDDGKEHVIKRVLIKYHFIDAAVK